MQPKKISGIILNNKPHLEFDRRISVFSHEYGKINVMAKGVRKITSHRGFHLDLLSYVQMEVEECGNGDSRILYLREISTVNQFSKMKNTPPNFAAACLISSFLQRILPEGASQKRLFNLTKNTFEALNGGINTKQTLFNYFLKMLRTLGYMPKTLRQKDMRKTLWERLSHLDPQFSLTARRTLWTFSKFDSTKSS